MQRGSRITLEETDDLVEGAINAVNNRDSTNPEQIAKIADYEQELELLKKNAGQAQEPAATPDGGGDGDAGTDPEADPEGGDPPAEGEEVGGAEENGLGTTEPSMEAFRPAQEAFECMVAIANVAEGLRNANKMGGASAQHARVAIETTNILAKRIGFPGVSARTYSVEAFESYSTRAVSTTIAIEGITDVAKDIWNAIKQFFRSVWNWVKEYLFGIKQEVRAVNDAYKEINETFRELDKKLKEKDAAILDLKMKKLKEKRYRARAMNLLTAGGEAGPEDLIANTEVLQQFVRSYFDTINSFLKGKFLPVVQELDKNDPDPNLCLVMFEEADFRGLKLHTGRESQGKRAIGQDMIVLMSEPLPGGKQLMVVCPKNNVRASDATRYQLHSGTQVDWVNMNEGGRSGGSIEVVTDSETQMALVKGLGNLTKVVGAAEATMDRSYRQLKQKTESFLAADMRDWVNLEPAKVKLLQALTNELLRLQMSVVERSAVMALKNSLAYCTSLTDYLTFSANQMTKVLDAPDGTATPAAA